MNRQINRPLVVDIFLVVLLGFVVSIRDKKQLIFIAGTKSHWNDHVRYCLDAYNGSLVTYDDEVVENAIQHYAKRQWKSLWTSAVWNGLYVSNVDNKTYYWQGSCENANYTNWETINDEQDKKCTKINPRTFKWNLAQCNETAYSICEKSTGPCVYEVEKPPTFGSCSMNSKYISFTSVNSMEKCHELCSSFDNCWATNYDAHTGGCYLSVSNDPFIFDVSGSIYSSPCTHHLHDTKLSWKRCFDHGIDTTRFPSNVNISTTEPNPFCADDETITHSPIAAGMNKMTALKTTEAITSTTEDISTSVQEQILGRQMPTTIQDPVPMETTISGDLTTAIRDFAQRPDANAQTTQTSTTDTVSKQSTSTMPTITAASTDTKKCPCKCYSIRTQNITNDLEEVLRSLKLNKKLTSSYRRKLTSAQDNRISAQGIGLSLGVGVISIVVLAIVLPDIFKVIKQLQSRTSNTHNKPNSA